MRFIKLNEFNMIMGGDSIKITITKTIDDTVSLDDNATDISASGVTGINIVEDNSASKLSDPLTA